MPQRIRFITLPETTVETVEIVTQRMPRTFRQWRKGLPGDPIASANFAGKASRKPFKVSAVEGALILHEKMMYPIHDRGFIVHGLLPVAQEAETGIFICHCDHYEKDPLYVTSLSPAVAQHLADDLRSVQQASEALKALAKDIGIVQQINHDLIYTPNVGRPEVLAEAGTDKWRALLKWKSDKAT